MTETASSTGTPTSNSMSYSENTMKSMTERANAAFRRVTVAVIEKAQQTGTPVIIWEDGCVREVPPEEMLEREEIKKCIRENQ